MYFYPLEERTYLFAKRCKDFTASLPKSLENIEYIKQLIRASGSQAANYIEANEALSKRDFIHRIKICIKEVKECTLWIQLCDEGQNKTVTEIKSILLKESIELRKIFGAILIKTKRPPQ